MVEVASCLCHRESYRDRHRSDHHGSSTRQSYQEHRAHGRWSSPDESDSASSDHRSTRRSHADNREKRRDARGSRSSGGEKHNIERVKSTKKRGLARWDADGMSVDGTEDLARQIDGYSKMTAAEKLKAKARSVLGTQLRGGLLHF